MSATWTLRGCQKRAFTMTFDIYKPTVARSSGRVDKGPMQLVAEDVPGRIDSKSEVSDLTPFGRGNIDQMDTTDRLRLPEVLVDAVNLQIGDGWMVQLKSGGGSENGAWCQIAGEGINLAFRAATRVYMITRNTLPPMVTP